MGYNVSPNQPFRQGQNIQYQPLHQGMANQHIQQQQPYSVGQPNLPQANRLNIQNRQPYQQQYQQSYVQKGSHNNAFVNNNHYNNCYTQNNNNNNYNNYNFYLGNRVSNQIQGFNSNQSNVFIQSSHGELNQILESQIKNGVLSTGKKDFILNKFSEKNQDPVEFMKWAREAYQLKKQGGRGLDQDQFITLLKFCKNELGYTANAQDSKITGPLPQQQHTQPHQQQPYQQQSSMQSVNRQSITKFVYSSSFPAQNPSKLQRIDNEIIQNLNSDGSNLEQLMEQFDKNSNHAMQIFGLNDKQKDALRYNCLTNLVNNLDWSDSKKSRIIKYTLPELIYQKTDIDTLLKIFDQKSNPNTGKFGLRDFQKKILKSICNTVLNPSDQQPQNNITTYSGGNISQHFVKNNLTTSQPSVQHQANPFSSTQVAGPQTTFNSLDASHPLSDSFNCTNPFDVEIDGNFYTFSNTGAAYHAQKFTEPHIIAQFQNLTNGQAFKLASNLKNMGQVKMKDWDPDERKEAYQKAHQGKFRANKNLLDDFYNKSITNIHDPSFGKWLQEVIDIESKNQMVLASNNQNTTQDNQPTVKKSSINNFQQVADRYGGHYYTDIGSVSNICIPKDSYKVYQAWKFHRKRVAKKLEPIDNPIQDIYKCMNSRQTARDPETLHKQATNAVPNFVQDVQTIANVCNAIPNFGPNNDFAVKKKKSLQDKFNKFGKDIDAVNDCLRGTVIVENIEQAKSVMRELKSKFGSNLYFKNYFEPGVGSGSYCGIHANLRYIDPNTKNVINSEIQIHFSAFFDGTPNCPKEQSHKLYKSNTHPDQIKERNAGEQLMVLSALETIK